MSGKPKLLAIVIFFVLCAGLGPLIVLPLPYQGLDWLSLGPVIAAYSTPVPSTPGPSTPGAEKGTSDSSQPVDEVLPGQAALVHDPETPNISIFFPAGAVSRSCLTRPFTGERLRHKSNKGAKRIRGKKKQFANQTCKPFI